MKKVILHIPHSSTKIPMKDGYIVSDELLKKEILKLTDWYSDDLFYSEKGLIIKADFSRIFCDPERFADDNHEEMARFGMGVLYEKNDDGQAIRIINSEIRNKILKEYYWKHHNKLTNAVALQLEKYGEALIIDCHSFPNIPFKRDKDQQANRPDFNIGTDSFHTPQNLIDISQSFFQDKGYTIAINRPYKGAIVPMEYYKQNKNVSSIMLEVNRKLYLIEATNKKSERYAEIKLVVGEFIELMRENRG